MKKHFLMTMLFALLCTATFITPGRADESMSNTAYPSTQVVNVDGTAVVFEMYALKDTAGNMTNYIKVRDLALALNGTAAQFDVDWNGAVNLLPGAAYRVNGSENQTPYSGERTYSIPSAGTNINGVASDLTAIVLTDDNGGGYTYYQLRDLGAHLNFEVGWTAEEGITVNTAAQITRGEPKEPPVTIPPQYDTHGWWINYEILYKKLPEGQELSYLVNVKSQKFHCEDCRTIKDGTEEEYWYETSAGYQTLIDSKYDPCGVCLKWREY